MEQYDLDGSDDFDHMDDNDVNHKSDLIKGIIPKNANYLSKQSKKFFGDIIAEIEKDIEPKVAILMAIYFAVINFKGFTIFNTDITLFKQYSNPEDELFNPILQNVLTADPTLQEKIAAIDLDREVDFIQPQIVEWP